MNACHRDVILISRADQILQCWMVKKIQIKKKCHLYVWSCAWANKKKLWVVVMQNIIRQCIKEFQDLYSHWQSEVNYIFSLIEPLIGVRLHRHGKINFCCRKVVVFLKILFTVSDLVCRQCFWDRRCETFASELVWITFPIYGNDVFSRLWFTWFFLMCTLG